MADIHLPSFTAAEFSDPVNLEVLENATKIIIETEAPISFDLYMERLCNACGITRKTQQVKDRCNYLIRRLRYKTTFENICDDPNSGRIFIWGNIENLPAYRPSDRDPKDIPIEEAAIAAVYLARSQFGMPKESLISEICKALGFKISTPTAKRLADKAIDFAVSSGELSEISGIIR